MAEKNYAPRLKEKKISDKKVNLPKVENKAPVKEEKKVSEKKADMQAVENKTLVEEKKETGKVEEKKVKEKKEVVKKDFACTNISSAKISTKTSVSICNFIRGKKIKKAIEDLEKVVLKKRAVPMKGEFAHRKGNIMSGRYPVNAAKEFIIFLKNLQSNAIQNGMEDAYVAEAISNIAPRPYGRFGRIRRKRTHIKLVAREKKEKSKK